MIAARRFTLDTNVLVYAVDADAGRRHQIARQVVERAALADCVLTLQSLAELFHVLTRRREEEPDDANTIVNNWRSRFPVHVADIDCLTEAMSAVAHHRLAFWDAMLWATARRAGCTVILTEDFQDGRELGGVSFLNPFAARPSPLLSNLLGWQAR